MRHRIYYSINPINGDDLFHAPNHFYAVAERDLLGNVEISVILHERRIAEGFFSIFENPSFARGIDSGLVECAEISGWNMRAIDKLIGRRQFTKAEMKIAGLLMGMINKSEAEYADWKVCEWE